MDTERKIQKLLIKEAVKKQIGVEKSPLKKKQEFLKSKDSKIA